MPARGNSPFVYNQLVGADAGCTPGCVGRALGHRLDIEIKNCLIGRHGIFYPKNELHIELAIDLTLCMFVDRMQNVAEITTILVDSS